MTERSVVHATFCLERTYPASPARVFAAFAEQEAKDKWFGAPGGGKVLERSFDFRVGGREVFAGEWADGHKTVFTAHYFDIVPGERIVYAYEMLLHGEKISVSLATIEIKPAGSGARITITEQGAFLDGYDDAGGREHGTNHLLDAVGASLGEVEA